MYEKVDETEKATGIQPAILTARGRCCAEVGRGATYFGGCAAAVIAALSEGGSPRNCTRRIKGGRSTEFVGICAGTRPR